MSSFTRAITEPVPGKFRGGFGPFKGRQVYRVSAYAFYIGKPGEAAIYVWDGFETDLASIPIWALYLLPPPIRRWVEAQLAKAAGLHDFMRECLDYALIDCDALMLVAMRADGVWPPLREIAFLAVRTNRSRLQHQPGAAK